MIKFVFPIALIVNAKALREKAISAIKPPIKANINGGKLSMKFCLLVQYKIVKNIIKTKVIIKLYSASLL